MKPLFSLLLVFLVLAGLMLFSGSVYTVKETEHVIITQFGDIVGEPISEAGLKFKAPFIQTVNRLEKRLLNWEGRAIISPTKDKAYLSVNTFARWRIVDPQQFFIRLRDLQLAESRIEGILGSETRNAIAKHELIEIVRTDKTRQPKEDETIKAAAESTPLTAAGNKLGTLPAIQVGRARIEQEIKDASVPKMKELGLELLDVRFKRINYEADVLPRVYERMVSERQQIAQRFRSEGGAEAARINGNRERDLFEIESTAYKQVQELRGQADAEASRIYAEAYGSNPRSAEFFEFLKGLDTYRSTIGKDTTLMLSTDSDFFRLLKAAREPLPAAETPPPPAGGGAPFGEGQ